MKLTCSLERSRYMQYVATLIATLTASNYGMYSTWPSPSLPKLRSEDSPIGVPITKDEESWIASSLALGFCLGSLASGICAEKLGRRGALLLSAIPMFIPWIIIVFAKSALVLIMARLLGGFGGGLAVAALAIYVGEISEKDVRGKLGTFLNVLKLSGSLFVLSIGPYISYNALALSCSVILVIFIVSFYFMPESPYYLIKVGKTESATKSFIRLSRSDADKTTIKDGLSEIQATVDHDMKNKTSLWETMTNRLYRKSLLIMLGIRTLQQFSGLSAINPYLQTIIKASNSSISPEISSLICGFVQIPAALLSTLLVDKMGRKSLLIISAVGCALTLSTEGIFFYLQDVAKVNVDSISWLPTVALMLYLIMNPLGVYTLPYVLSGEIFATNIKGNAVMIISVYGAFIGFLIVRFFGPISDAWGMHTIFWIFAGSCSLGAIFVFVCLPETKGKTFMEIQNKINRNWLHNDVK